MVLAWDVVISLHLYVILSFSNRRSESGSNKGLRLQIECHTNDTTFFFLQHWRTNLQRHS